jgi:hypothetical protein
MITEEEIRGLGIVKQRERIRTADIGQFINGQ